MKTKTRAYLELHLAVLLFGFTAILGDLIQLNPLILVWWRVLLTSASFFLIIKVFNYIKSLPRKLILTYSLIGIIVSFHWLFFFGSIKYSNASITLICMATTSFFTALIEPFIMKSRILWLELFIGIIIIPAMVLIISEIDLSKRLGALFGLISAVMASLFTVFNKKYIQGGKEKEITFIELSSATLFLTVIITVFGPYLGIEKYIPAGLDWLYLVILALLCTTLAFVLALRSLNHISAFASNLTINLEPIYGILLAMLILKEHKELSIEFYLGVCMIILAVFLYPILIRKVKR